MWQQSKDNIGFGFFEIIYFIIGMIFATAFFVDNNIPAIEFILVFSFLLFGINTILLIVWYYEK